MNKPLTPKLHGIIDYGFAAALLLAPSILKLNRPAKNLAYSTAAHTIAFTALSDTPVAVRRVFSFNPAHKLLDISTLAGLLVLPRLTGAARQPRARRFFAGMLLAGITAVLLTDYNGDTSK